MLLHRWEVPWHWLLYGTLIASTAIAVGDEETTWRRLAMLALAAFLALWYWRMVVRGRCLQGSLGWVLANLIFAAALWVPLLLWNGIFLLMMFSAYSLVCSLPLRGAIPGIAAVSALVVATTSVREGSFDALLALIYVVVTVAIALLVVMVRGIERQSAERKQLIDELEATRDELAESERQAGVLAERQRLAREIHDTLAQGFTSIVALHEAARAESASRPEVALQHLDEASHYKNKTR